jgi:sugar O-acyltransferase (sialic acid O-acetyltransferase NeuD family)
MKPVVVFGIGDFARIAHVYLTNDSVHDVAAFTVDEQYLARGELLGMPVVPFEELERTHPPSDYAMLVAIGFSKVNKARTTVYHECKRRGYDLITYVSSEAHLVADVQLGDNCFIFEANVIQPFVRIGNNVVMWSGNHIGHDTTIGDNVFIASHAVVSGNCTIGDSCFVGVNATLRDGVSVASECVIGASATVMKDTERGDVLAVRGTEVFPKKSWDLSL